MKTSNSLHLEAPEGPRKYKDVDGAGGCDTFDRQRGLVEDHQHGRQGLARGLAQASRQGLHVRPKERHRERQGGVHGRVGTVQRRHRKAKLKSLNGFDTASGDQDCVWIF